MELSNAQKDAINCIDQNLQIVACAGSGKTEVITRRICNILLNKCDVLPENVVAFTFTNKAADNMRERISKIISESGNSIDISGMYIGTIHSFCKYVLDLCAKELEGYQVLDAAKEHLFMMKNYHKSGAEALGLYRRDAALFSSCIDKMVYMYERESEWTEESKIAFTQYCQLLHENRFLDFPMLIYEVIRRSDNPELCSYFEKIKYLIVDEYQDVDDLQEMIIQNIVKHGANVCVVGDDDQTIYQFRGSNANNMIGFSKRYLNVKTIHLDVNYRCGKNIVAVADAVIKNNENRLEKTMSASTDSELGIVEGQCFDGDEEYEELAKKILQIHMQGVDFSEMAILIRKRSNINSITSELSRFGIPFHAEDNASFFSGMYFKKFCNIASFLVDASDENRTRIVEDWKDLVDIKGLKRGLRKLDRAKETNARFESVFIDFLEELKVDELKVPIDGMDLFERILSDFDQIYVADSWTVKASDFNSFLREMAQDEYLRTELQESIPVSSVSIMTVHKAKGLEYEAVFIPDMQQGFFPANRIGGRKYYSVLGGVFADEKDQFESTLEDERKLFYVALTRAKRYLYVCANVEKKEPSIFLYEMNASNNCAIRIPSQSKKEDHDGNNIWIKANSNKMVGKRELWQIYDMKAIRKATLDELHGAAFAGHFGGAYLELEEARKASDEELLKIASRTGIRIEKYRRER